MNFFRWTTSKSVMAPIGASPEAGSSDQEIPDLDLIKACQGGDSKAFESLVTRHRGKVYAMVQNMIKNEADAWDLSQEVFLKVWKALPKFEARAKFSTWLYRITHNVVYDWLRKRGLMAENNMPSTWDSIIQEPDTVWSQLSVTTDDDRIYHCTNTGLFADAAIELPDIDREGNVALYCDKLTLPDGTEKEQSTTRTEGWGDRLTYIPASRIRRVQLRVQRKKQKGTANTLSHLNTEDPSSPID